MGGPWEEFSTKQTQDEDAAPWTDFAPVQEASAPETRPSSEEDGPWKDVARINSVPEKPTFQTIYDDKELGKVAKDFYSWRDGKTFNTDREAIDEFVHDRVWKDANTASTIGEAIRTKGRDDNRNAQLAYLKQYWEKLPYFWQDGGRGAKGFVENAAKGIIDPVNIAAGAAAAVAAPVAAAATGARVLASPLGRKAVGAGVGALADAGVGAAANLASQSTDKSIGLRDELSGTEALKAGALNAVASGLATAGIGTIAGKLHGTKPTGVPEIDAVKAKIGGEPSTVEGIQGTMGRVVQETADFLNPMKLYQKEIKGYGGEVKDLKKATLDRLGTDEVDPGLSPYVQARQLVSSNGRALEMLQGRPMLPPEKMARAGEAQYHFADHVEPLMKIVEPFKDNNDVGNFMLYVGAKRVKDIRDSGRLGPDGKPIKTFLDDPKTYTDAGYSQADAQRLAADAADRIVAWGQTQPGFVEQAAKLKDFTDHLALYQHKSDLIDGDSFLNLVSSEAYVPLYQSSNLMETIARQAGAANAPNAPARIRMKGSENNVAPLLDSLVQYTFKAVAGSDRNRAKLSFFDMMNEGIAAGAIDPATSVRKLEPHELMSNGVAIRSSAVKGLKDQGATVDLTGATPESMLNVVLYGRPNKDNVEAVFRNGKLEYYEIRDPDLVRMFGYMNNHEEVGAFTKKLNAISGAYSRFITLNPVFASKNIVRDTVAAAGNSEFGFVPGFSSAKGLVQSFASQEKVRNAIVNGMAHTTREETQGVYTAAKNMEHALADPSMNAWMKDSLAYMNESFLHKGWDGYKSFVEKTELASRMAEFSNALNHGMSPLTASFAGREVSTDFAMHGLNQTLGTYARLTPFLNASFQGFYKLGRTTLNNLNPRSGASLMDRAKFAGIILATVVGPDFLMHLHNKDDPEYKDIPATVRAQNLLLPVYKDAAQVWDYIKSGGKGPQPERERYIAIPKPYDFGALGTMVNGLYDSIMDRNGAEAAKAFKQAVFQAVPGFELPMLARPAWELANNRDWKDQPITPDYLKDREKVNQFTDSTSTLSQDIVRGIEQNTRWMRGPGARGFEPIAPTELDYITNYFMPGLLQLIPQIAGEIYYSEAKHGPQPDKRADEFNPNRPWTWVTKSWTIATPQRSSESLNELYELKEQLKGLTSGRTQLLSGQSTYRQGLEDMKLPAVKNAEAAAGMVDQATKSIASLRDAQHAERDNLRHDGETKRKKLDALTQQRNDIARQTMDMLKRQKVMDPYFSSVFNQTPSENYKEATPDRYKPKRKVP